MPFLRRSPLQQRLEPLRESGDWFENVGIARSMVFEWLEEPATRRMLRKQPILSLLLNGTVEKREVESVSRSQIDSFEMLREEKVDEYTLASAARCGSLCAASYANADSEEAFADLGCLVVASGVSSDVSWHVVDSAREGKLERHVVVRGFDASDSTVDRVSLVRRIVAADPVPLPISPLEEWLGNKRDKRGVHLGFLVMAQEVLKDVEPYLQRAKHTKLILTGHSIGGSICVVLSMLLAGKVKLSSVVTFAALPCTTGYQNDQVVGLVQPWDPLVRWYSQNDPCYPLVSDCYDGVTLFASGPPRALRPVARAVFRSTPEYWPQVRDIYSSQANQSYTPVGNQYLILPETSRYVSDRNVGWQIDVPTPVSLSRPVGPDELHQILNDLFPLDEYSISLVPAAVRSFVHHFYPAYSETLSLLLDPASEADEEQRQEQQRPYDLGSSLSFVTDFLKALEPIAAESGVVDILGEGENLLVTKNATLSAPRPAANVPTGGDLNETQRASATRRSSSNVGLMNFF